MNINSEQRELIEGLIKQNQRFKGHEDMLDLICAEVYKKSYLLLDSVSNIESLKKYLVRVVDNTVLSLIKRSNSSFGSKKIVSLDSVKVNHNKKSNKIEKQDVNIEEENDNIEDDIEPQVQEDIKEVREVNQPTEEIIEQSNPYEGLIDPLEIFPKEPTSDLQAKRIIDAIVKLDEQEPNKKYLEIFNLKYVQKIHQSKIAHSLKLSQADLSKRFCEMSKFVQLELS